MRGKTIVSLLLGTMLSLGVIGCSTTAPDRAIRMTRGYVFYLDGAGGGHPLHNWASGVRKGLLDAGYDGAGEMFTWQTGRSVVADQSAGVAYKRAKAARLANEIQNYQRSHPDAPVTVMALSAGTAIAVYALEALPPGPHVDNVVLLSGSLSSGYDLTEALQRVRGRVYVFTSERDAVLRFLVPIGGTADREAGDRGTIGVNGIRMPRRPSQRTRMEYGKLVHIGWNKGFIQYGHLGGHVDSVNARFVQAVVAPLVMRTDTRVPAPAVVTGKVPNPDYERWAKFAPGSWVRLRGFQVIEGVRQSMTVKATLVARYRNKLIIDREFLLESDAATPPPLSRRFFVTARIDPKNHPLAHPDATITNLPRQSVVVKSQQLACTGRSVTVAGSFPEWGSNIEATLYTSDALPGGVARIQLKSHMRGRPVEFAGEVVDFRVAAR